MRLDYRIAQPTDSAECIRIRGLTRENAVSREQLQTLGITAASWAAGVSCGDWVGFVCTAEDAMAGYCFGAARTGEVLVLALLPSFEGRGVGRELLRLVVSQLRALGHERLFLGCSPDLAVRSYGFYRHLGWRSTETFDAHGDEILERVFS